MEQREEMGGGGRGGDGRRGDGDERRDTKGKAGCTGRSKIVRGM